VEVISTQPERDAERLLRRFLERAYRTPVSEADVPRFLAIARHAWQTGQSFQDGMLAAYTAVLSSPGFLYFHETPGPLADGALAERLSYFLWNSCPDAELRQLAARGDLHRPSVLRQQKE